MTDYCCYGGGCGADDGESPVSGRRTSHMSFEPDDVADPKPHSHVPDEEQLIVGHGHNGTP